MWRFRAGMRQFTGVLSFRVKEGEKMKGLRVVMKEGNGEERRENGRGSHRVSIWPFFLLIYGYL